MSYKNSSSSPSLLRITVGNLGLKATWSGTAFYTALLSMGRWTLSPLCSVGVSIYLFFPAVCCNSSRGWGSAKPLLKQSTPSVTLEERCDLCSGFVSTLTRDIKRKWMVLQDISTSFQTETYGTTMPQDLSHVLSHPNRADLRQIKCPCESCKMPLYYDAPSKQIQCSGPSDVTGLLMLCKY